MSDLQRRIADITQRSPVRLSALQGGCVAEVYRVDFERGEPLVAKFDGAGGATLGLEGRMLEYLAPHLPVPEVVHSEPGLLLMEYVRGTPSFSRATQCHAAELLANLHSVQAPDFGFAWDTVIGALPQPNPETGAWTEFFAEHRLVYMAEVAHARGRLPASMRRRVEVLAERLGGFLREPDAPSLVHGDVWSGNVLADGGKVQAFLDPAIYFGHAEVELAFIVMFSTFGDPFFEAYQEVRPIEEGFFEQRVPIYNLYPNLVHVTLFGGSYVQAVDATLAAFGVRA